MSLTSDRAAIASALDALTDITGYADEPAMMAVGDAWVRWAGYDPTGVALVFATTWKIFVVTGGTPTNGMEFCDSHLATILDSLDQLVYIIGVTPVEFQLANNVLYGVEITTQKES